jgi:hypothetical protein
LALWFGLAGPTAAPARAAGPARPAVVAVGVVAVPLAEQFSWREFVKFWKRQAGRTSGVVGIVLLIGLGAMLLILSKNR